MLPITGSFVELPWTEVLRFLERNQITGCLTLQPQAEHPYISSGEYEIWFKAGYGLSAAPRNQPHHLLQLVQHQGWLQLGCGQRLAKTLPEQTPLGVHLKAQGVLTHRQLQTLFQIQVMQPLIAIGQCTDAQFQLVTRAELPWHEMTGLKVAIYDLQALCPYVAA
jgi:hypothetical protein